MSIMVAGLFDTSEQAMSTVEGLRAVGFPDKELTLISDKAATSNDEDHRRVVGAVLDKAADDKPSVGTAVGVGVASGAALVALAAFGVLALPIAAPVTVLGWFATTVVTTAWGGTLGGLIASLVEEGVPEELGKRYADLVHHGKALVIVRVGDDDEAKAEVARGIMRSHGMLDEDHTDVVV